MEPGLVANPAADLGIEVELFLVDQTHHDRSKIGLADASGKNAVAGLHVFVRFDVR